MSKHYRPLKIPVRYSGPPGAARGVNPRGYYVIGDTFCMGLNTAPKAWHRWMCRVLLGWKYLAAEQVTVTPR